MDELQQEALKLRIRAIADNCARVDLGGEGISKFAFSRMIRVMSSVYKQHPVRSALRFYLPFWVLEEWIDILLWHTPTGTFKMPRESIDENQLTIYGISWRSVEGLEVIILTFESNWPALTESACVVIGTGLRRSR